MENPELKPCPFCGQALTVFTHIDKPSVAKCSTSGCLMTGYWIGESWWNQWNTRPIEDGLQEEVAKLKESIESLRLEMK